MQNQYRSLNIRQFLLTFSLYLIASQACSDDPKIRDSLKICAAISSAEKRIACYDTTVGQYLNQPQEQPARKKSDVKAYKTTIDKFGENRLRNREKTPDAQLFIEAEVVSCSKNPVGKYVFILDNGQVWRQTDSQRLRKKTCSFSATVKKIGSGYRLIEKDVKGYIRVTRLK